MTEEKCPWCDCMVVRSFDHLELMDVIYHTDGVIYTKRAFVWSDPKKYWPSKVAELHVMYEGG